MPIDKILQRIQIDIKELAPTLELFVERSIQPTAEECDKMEKQLHGLLSDLAVYRHYREQHEVSPSYNLHAKISEVTSVRTEKELPPPPPPVAAEVQQTDAGFSPKANVKPLSIALNDKFRYINELFAQNGSEYAIAVEQLNNVQTWAECEVYLNSLKNLYEWDENQDIVKQFFAMLKKRYS